MSHFWKYFQQNLYCDVTIKIHINEYKCHRVILSRPNSFFEGLLSSGFLEQDQKRIEIDISDQEKNFLNILEYLYTGSMPQLNQNNCFRICYLATYFNYIEIVEECNKFISKSFPLSLQSIFKYKDHSYCFPEPAINYLAGEFYKIYKDEMFSKLNNFNILKICSSPYLKLNSELDLVLYLAELIKKIRDIFGLLSDSEMQVIRKSIEWESLKGSEWSSFNEKLFNLPDNMRSDTIFKRNNKIANFDNDFIALSFFKETKEKQYIFLKRYNNLKVTFLNPNDSIINSQIFKFNNYIYNGQFKGKSQFSINFANSKGSINYISLDISFLGNIKTIINIFEINNNLFTFQTENKNNSQFSFKLTSPLDKIEIIFDKPDDNVIKVDSIKLDGFYWRMS